MLRSLQACRAVAALLVVLFHTSGIFQLAKYFGHKPFGRVFDLGFVGVDFFFVLSGFIMMYVHADDIGRPRALGSYLWKRFSRVYPAYWFVLALVLPVYFVMPSYGKGFEREPDVIVRSVFLIPHSQAHMVLVVAWTLMHEMLFYLVFGLLILNRRMGVVVLAAWLLGLLAYPWFEGMPPFLFSPMNLRFLAGIGVALVIARWQIPWPRLVAGVGAAILFGAGTCEAYGEPLSTGSQTLCYTLGSVLMLAGLVQAEKSGMLDPPQWLVYLGNASYSIYLVHFLGLSVFAKITKAAQLDVHVPSTVLFGLHVVGSIVIGCAFHHLVEHPIHAWAKQLFRRESTPMPVPVLVQPALRRAA